MKRTKLSKIAAVIAAGAACAAMGFAAVACGDGDDHTHKWDEVWTTSTTEHWHACTVKGCTAKKDKHKHEDSEDDDDTLCDTCGYDMGEEGPGGETGDHTITLDKSMLNLSIDNLTYTLAPTLGVSTDEVTWTATGDAVTVGTNGLVTAVKPGTATITASISEDVSATCEVTVATAYYLIGDPSTTAWTGVGTFGVSGVKYFTLHDGVYATESFKLAKNGTFKVGIVGITAEPDMWDAAINASSLKGDEVYLKSAGGWQPNFTVEHSGKYTIKLDLTDADNPKVYSSREADLSDEDSETIYYVRGDNNGWGEVTEDAVATSTYVFKDVDGVLTATVHFNAEQKFKVAIVGSANDGWAGALSSGNVAGTDIVDKGSEDASKPLRYNTGVDDNIVAYAAGTYTLTIVDGTIHCTFVAD